MLLMFLNGNYIAVVQNESLIFRSKLEYSHSIFIILFWLVMLPLNNVCSVLEVRLQIANQNVFNQRTCMQK
jgi:hypothetical protein